MLKMFKLEAFDDQGRAVQTLSYRYGRREAHLAPDARKILSRMDRAAVANMRARGLTVRATREAI